MSIRARQGRGYGKIMKLTLSSGMKSIPQGTHKRATEPKIQPMLTPMLGRM